MPKTTFFNLAEEKRNNLIRAAKQEFSVASLPEASIANIIKAVGIPRGSFYQYFEDKEDLYFYLVNNLMEKQKAQFKKALIECRHDVFGAMTLFYKESLMEEDDIAFKKNIFLNMNNKVENTFSHIMMGTDSQRPFREIESLIDRSKLNITNDKELYYLLKILFTITIHNRVEKFSKNLSVEESAAVYEIEMNLVKKGLAKNEA